MHSFSMESIRVLIIFRLKQQQKNNKTSRVNKRKEDFVYLESLKTNNGKLSTR